ncbi:50S ribosomal protein L32 [Candidatus Acetothermia bacterium]|nr:50S ribosomal protein L32 [Candidatus Acetothermia bacterium]MBI3643491.1 50S ribosomal protein L32 [Candidatus Acetothermia bacterium]
MGVPKKRRSRRERKHHQGHQRMSTVTVSSCPRCHEPKLSHRVCMNCGYYRGMEVISMETEEE